MTRVLYENEKLKLIESMGEYILVSDDMRIVCDENCKVNRVIIGK